MKEPKILPPLFMEMIDRVDKVEALTPEIMARFYAIIDEHETFLPELIAAIGPATFELLVKYYGGRKFRLPKADEIIKMVKEHERLQEHSSP